MASAAGSLDEFCRENRLFPRERGFMSFGDFGCCALAAVADGAAPIADIVRNWRMRAIRLRYGRAGKAGLHDSLMAGGATIHNVHAGNPDLIDVRAIVGEKLFGIGARLRVFSVGTFVLLPFAAKILDRRNGEHAKKYKSGNRKHPAHTVRNSAHLLSRHEFSKARPKTSQVP